MVLDDVNGVSAHQKESDFQDTNTEISGSPQPSYTSLSDSEYDLEDEDVVSDTVSGDFSLSPYEEESVVDLVIKKPNNSIDAPVARHQLTTSLQEKEVKALASERRL